MSESYSRKNPFKAEVLKNINLNKEGSKKETRHIELSLKDSGLEFKPGDCLGIYPENDPELVNALIEEMKWDDTKEVVVNKNGDKVPLREALEKHLEITLLNKRMVKKAAALSDNEELQALAESDQLKEYMDGRDLFDLLREFKPWKANEEDIVSLLRNMPPRLYSIASSLKAYPGEVHLTIGAVRWYSHGRERKGVCSVQCSERLDSGDTLPVFIQKNNHFSLPESAETDIIMVGPGTGIAPFRSFIQEREHQQDKGKAWLFFGDQHEKTDFLYEEEFKNSLERGTLTHLTTAFSRDSDKKVYVQHRLEENGKEIYQWLENGAIFYVCGDKERMAKDVHQALIDIIKTHGNRTDEEAEETLKQMKKEHRYLRDVY
ncbi:sulfite reductase subunit alpha [Bacillus shivajii]|uniref:sulfite reductase subunit alpha n=1 Tax=Bacillus shivajii TaxID=1983719 RepID=UPI0021F53E77|nr:sulfite reductase subunit alpha [Bacillus shivajii]